MDDKVLIDTSAFYALISSADEFHPRARSIYSDLLDQRAELYTTSYVLVECMSLVQRRLGFDALTRFVTSIENVVGIMWIDSQSHQAAWDMLRARRGRGLSLVDCTTVVLARSLDSRVFAFDDDFLREDLVVLR